jgi:hypothetical protein
MDYAEMGHHRRQLGDRLPLRVRIERRIRKTDGGCWEWAGTKNVAGYGAIMMVRPEGGRRKQAQAHRVSWEAYVGVIPAGMFVLHRCDNPPCVNPEHLFLGTNKENALDCRDKGRTNAVRGARHPLSKLTDETAREMALMVVSGASKASIARHFGVGVGLVRWMAAGHRWRHAVSDIIPHSATCAECRRRIKKGRIDWRSFVPAERIA